MRSAKGSIEEIEKGKLYRVFVSSGYDPITGKRTRPSAIVRGSRKQAEEKKIELLIKSGNGDSVGDLTLDTFWRAFYLSDVESRLRASTVQGYKNHYKVHIQKQLGGYKLRKITPAVISNWQSGIDGQCRKREAYKILRQMLNRAERLGLIDQNPIKRVDPPKTKTTYDPEVLSSEEVREYLRLFRGSPIEPAVLVAIGGGLRRSEIVALDWSDINAGIVTVDNAVTSIGGKPNDDEPKSQFSKRKVHLPNSIAERLEEMRSDAPLVVDSNGKRMNPDNLSHYYQKALKSLPDGVKRIPFKNLRHTSLTLTAEACKDILAVSRRAGHSSISITSKYYLRPHDSVDEDAASGLDSLLS